MTRWRLPVAVAWLALVAPLVAPSAGQTRPAEIVVESTPTAVTAYRGRAAVTRAFSQDLAAGQYTLIFRALPASAQAESLQARIRGAARVLGVDAIEEAGPRATSPRAAALDARIAQLEASLGSLAGERELNVAERAFIDGVAARATGDARADVGRDRLSLDAVREHLAFVTAERRRLLEARRVLDERSRHVETELARLRQDRAALDGSSSSHRHAAVSIDVRSPGIVALDLTYLVANATWRPAYGIRARPDGSRVEIEYDAELDQRTGEDWRDVVLTLSTAQPTRAAHPPTLEPWFVEVRDPASAAAPRSVRAAGTPLERLDEDAVPAGAGPSVTFAIPRPVTVPTDARRAQRTRIASFGSSPRFTHVAIPLLTEAVYVRAELSNESPYLLLPGAASIFVGADYVGQTSLDTIVPAEPFEIFLGIDQTVKTQRRLLTKSTAKTGLLGGGRRTSYEYRIDVENGAGKPLTLELWDRIPVSRSDLVNVQLVNADPPLATDADYRENDEPRGLLKWLLTVPDGTFGTNAFRVSYGLRVVRAKDTEITPLPD